jgi:NADH:ubiquinone oxidoreductase subunit 2 (subunit N)
LLQCLALASIAYGTFAALYEYRLKRFLAYSSISNMGFVLLGFSLHHIPGFTSSILYFVIYLLTTLAFFGLLMQFTLELNLMRKDIALESLELKQIFSLQYYQSHPAYLFAFSLLILSFGGIPPLAGFFIKLFLLKACFVSGNYLMAFFVFLFSVISLAFYLRLLRILFVHPLKLTFSQASQRNFLLMLSNRPLTSLYLLATLVLLLVFYGLLFHNFFIILIHFLAISSGYF